jgi:hypothetical protein
LKKGKTNFTHFYHGPNYAIPGDMEVENFDNLQEVKGTLSRRSHFDACFPRVSDAEALI